MAYVRCTQCGLIAFTAAYWSSTDYCGRCGAELPRPRAAAASRAQAPQPQREPSPDHTQPADDRAAQAA